MAAGTPKVLITGTSTGIGYDAARYLIANGFEVFGSVRQAADGERVRAQLGEGFTPLIFDVTDDEAIAAAAEELNGRSIQLHGLVNNAGIAVSGPAALLPLSEWQRQLDVNFFGAIRVTQAFLPLMTAGSRIINISSVSGKIGFPFFGPYAASKFALEAFSDSLRRELLTQGIDVIVIEPGSIKTPIWDKAKEEDMPADFADTRYAKPLRTLANIVQKSGETGLPVEKVSLVIHTALTVRNPKPRYALPNNWLFNWILPRFAPTRLVDRVIVNQIFGKNEQ